MPMSRFQLGYRSFRGVPKASRREGIRPSGRISCTAWSCPGCSWGWAWGIVLGIAWAHACRP
eukprot:13699866-Alexandrium_andersonii.AAC.1